ncbi:hypothetical protein ACNSOL_12265 (plasmid) [Aliarcobacter lanthieri]
MRIIYVNEYSYDIDFQAYVDGQSTIDRGEEVVVITTLDNVAKTIEKQ